MKISSNYGSESHMVQTVLNLSISVAPTQIQSHNSVTRITQTKYMFYLPISAANLTTLQLMNVTLMMETTQLCLRQSK